MRRIVFSGLAIFSAILAVALWAACTRTWFVQDAIHRAGWESSSRWATTGIAWANGRIVVWRETINTTPHRTEKWRGVAPTTRFISQPRIDDHAWDWSWYVWESEGSVENTVWRAGFRIWPVALTTMVLPGSWMGRMWRRRQVRRKGLCPNCRYDLRATRSRCPECGYEPQPA